MGVPATKQSKNCKQIMALIKWWLLLKTDVFCFNAVEIFLNNSGSKDERNILINTINDNNNNK